MAGKTEEEYRQSFADFKEATRKILGVTPADIKKQDGENQKDTAKK